MWKDFVLGDGSKVVKKVEIDGKVAFQRSTERLVPFTSNPVPTSWNEVTVGVKYNSTNTYGTWTIWGDNFSSSSYYVYKAYDGDTSTRWISADHSSSSVAFYIGIDMPSNVSINPTNIYVYSRYEGNSSYPAKVQGYNTETNSWEDLGTITRHSSATASNITVSNSNYYSSFRLQLYRYSSSYEDNRIYEFQITSGTLKIVS